MKRMKRYLSSLMTVVMLLTLLPTAALAVEETEPQTDAPAITEPAPEVQNETSEPEVPAATEPTETPEVSEPKVPAATEAPVTPVEGAVARIGDKTYATLDEAIDSVQNNESATIEILQDCSSNRDKGFWLAKDLKFVGNGQTISFATGFCIYHAHTVGFENLTVNMNDIPFGSNDIGVGTFPCGIVINPNAVLNIKDCTFNIQRSSGDGIYFHAGAAINIDHSTVNVCHNHGNGITQDNGDCYLNITNGSTVKVNQNGWNGITGPSFANVTVNASTLDISENRIRGMHCGKVHAENGATITVHGNNSDGLNLNGLWISGGSTVTSTENGAIGIRDYGDFQVDGTSKLTASGNATHGSGAGLRISSNTAPHAHVKAGAEITICDNHRNGLENYRTKGLTFEEGVKLTITGNSETNNGGGVFNKGTLVLPSDAVIYNNHAGKSGDDICNRTETSVITFGSVGEGWKLDGKQGNCEQLIDSWYDDSTATRWNAHTPEDGKFHVVPVAGGQTFTGCLALKAAHGILEKTVYSPVDLTFKKVSSEGNTPLPGAEFTLTGGTKYTSGRNGEFTLTGLVPGTYTLMETKTPDEYKPLSGSITIKIAETARTTEQTVVDGEIVNLTTVTAKVGSITGAAGDYKEVNGTHFIYNQINPDAHSKNPNLQFGVSKSKTATNLDKNFQSKVTLSLPSAEEKLDTDVVFVLDKSSSAHLEKPALNLLSNLKAHINGTGAQVKVGVVIFNKVANVTGFKDLATEYDAIEAAFKQTHKDGTNTHAGLLAAKAMLDADTSVSADRKYLIFVSDGITYLFNEQPTAVAWNGIVDNSHLGDDAVWANWTSPECWKLMYGDQKFIPASWDTWMDEIHAKLEKQGTAYDYPYKGTIVNETPKKAAEYKNYAMSVDKALYLTAQTYHACEEAGYRCYAMTTKVNEDAANANPWGPSFMEYLANGKTVTFDQIQNDIYYLLASGSLVKDVIGSGKDNEGNSYNMDFIPRADALKLTVGGKVLNIVDLTDDIDLDSDINHSKYETARFGFRAKETGPYDFIVHYFANGEDGKSDECFVWNINGPVSNFAHVQLTYTVKLTNPQKAEGTYGKYDADGSEKYSGLYTNKSATLYPMDSNGDVGHHEDFAKPTVSYTVKHSGGGSGGGGDHKPVLNTKDHYSYIIGYKDGFVRPYGTITRGEVVTIFFRLLTDEVRDKYWSQTNPFSDCSSDLWCNNAISTLYNMGQETGVHIVDGFLDGTFRPYGKITRAQFAKIAVGFFEETAKEYEGLYTDVADNAWYTSYIEAASRVGLIQGFEDGTFRPNVNITRAQACVIVNRALDRHPDEEHLLPTRVMVNWPDNNPGDWYYADMMEATNSHDYRWKHTHKHDENGKPIRYEDWTDKLPQRDWAAYEHAWSNSHSSQGGEVVKG